MKQCIGEGTSVVIVIPLYKTSLSSMEELSLRQCLTVLCSYPITFVTFDELDTGKYAHLCKQHGVNAVFEFFPKSFFSSVKGYNSLCLSRDFYERFQFYEYMLIYQLDAFVFRDELYTWCSGGYDFIGAPWFAWDRIKDCLSKKKFLAPVGNGGFSLRRVGFCSDVLAKCLASSTQHARLCPWSKRIELLLQRQFSVFKVLSRYEDLESFYRAALSYEIAEDVFFAYQKYSCLGANLPSVKTAMAFSFELYPSAMYRMNGRKLPCGCHAFEKHEWDSFWHKYIPSSS